jgi:hypothetical protein
MLRHTVATLAYRAGKVVRNAPNGFGEFRVSPESRSAGEILAHMGDLFDWALTIAEGRTAWSEKPPQAWDADVERFFDTLARFDATVTRTPPGPDLSRQLFQGPIADALQHTGQLALMRRLAGAPIKPENYFVAVIAEGRVGADQAPPEREF